MPTIKRRLKRFSLISQEDEPDTRQMDYEDMFTALVPQSERRKGAFKSRHTLQIPPLSGQDYLDELLFYSRTKPLPPLPENETPYKIAKSAAGRNSDTSSWSDAVRRWKHQLRGVDDSSRSITPETATRYCSLQNTKPTSY